MADGKQSVKGKKTERMGLQEQIQPWQAGTAFKVMGKEDSLLWQGTVLQETDGPVNSLSLGVWIEKADPNNHDS